MTEPQPPHPLEQHLSDRLWCLLYCDRAHAPRVHVLDDEHATVEITVPQLERLLTLAEHAPMAPQNIT
jgi:hypothetical protein